MKNNLLSINEYRNNPEFYFYKGLRCANKKNLSDAYKNLQRALELEPDNSEYKFNIACFLSELKRPKDANRIFNDILLNFDPSVYDCYFGLGCNSFEIGNTEKAAEYFEKYLYFDGDGEFSDEVAEMIFYLKLYEGISHDNRFVRRSESYLRKAKKFLKEDGVTTATKELYKSISANPCNVEARNLLTLTLLEQQKFIRAEYINKTVHEIDQDNVWANCLYLYVLLNSGKHNRVNKLLETLTFGEIEDRKDLLCAATTLLVFNKIDQLIILIEMYIIEYYDSLIYSILLIGYVITRNLERCNEIINLLSSYEKTNIELIKWLEYIKNYFYSNNERLLAVDEYNRVFTINNEANDVMYNPIMYQELYVKMKTLKPKLCKRYLPIIHCAVQNREIMYTRYYEKEIIAILNDCLSEAKEPLEAIDNGVAEYSAALEYIYCKHYFVDMGKEELIKKYNLSSITFDKALKKLNSRL